MVLLGVGDRVLIALKLKQELAELKLHGLVVVAEEHIALGDEVAFLYVGLKNFLVALFDRCRFARNDNTGVPVHQPHGALRGDVRYLLDGNGILRIAAAAGHNAEQPGKRRGEWQAAFSCMFLLYFQDVLLTIPMTHPEEEKFAFPWRRAPKIKAIAFYHKNDIFDI